MGYIELQVLDNKSEKLAVGIDLGTTNSLAARFVDGRPEVIRAEGHPATIPSAFYFPVTGLPIVGRRAREHAMIDPSRALFSIKRLMGRGLKELGSDLAQVPFDATETEGGVVQLDIDGKQYTPQELSSLILMAIDYHVGQSLPGAEIGHAVITVPAYFDEAQRQATKTAARLAGIRVLRIINEPTAASLAYGLDQKNEGTVAVYDLGGGTFDVSLLSIEEGVFRVLSTSGDTHLGGDDFDGLLVNLAMSELDSQLPDEAKTDRAFRQGLRLAAEKCKMKLSAFPEAELHLSAPEYGLNWRRTVTREEFDTLAAALVERTLDACKKALADAKLKPADIDDVVLVGGSTRIPRVRARVQEFFGRVPHTEHNPDEVVALGAAIQAHVLMGGTRDILLLDVTPLSLGLETMGGATTKLIARNTTLPCQATETFTTYADNQTGLDLHILQGERELAKDCRTLGKFKLSGIPPMPAGLARIQVRFLIDADGTLTVTAKEQATGASANIEVQPMNGLTDGQVETMLAESFEHAREDFDARHLADLRIEIEIMLKAIDKNLERAKERLDPESVADLTEARDASRALLKDGALAETQSARDALERASTPLAAVLMDDVAKSALAGRSLGEV